MRSIPTPTVGTTGDAELWNRGNKVSLMNNSDVVKTDTSSIEKNFDHCVGGAEAKEVGLSDSGAVGLVDFGEDFLTHTYRVGVMRRMY